MQRISELLAKKTQLKVHLSTGSHPKSLRESVEAELEKVEAEIDTLLKKSSGF
ncbi:MAG: hypothetical protein OEW12_06205 [Deltaproteobacteria bacterium]|nr:hypothetical protein [Deltaproteobacteria bacterium]